MSADPVVQGLVDLFQIGYSAGLEAAAKICEERAVVERAKASTEMDADACGRALSREASARWCSAAIRSVIVT